jgi:HSP20 family protein
MKLEIWDVPRELERRFDDLFRLFPGPRGRFFYPELPSAFGIHTPFVPATDVFARNGDLVVRLEIAGVDPKKDVTLTVDDGDLVIRGKRQKKEEVKQEDFYRMETSYGAFERHVGIPQGISDKDIEAVYNDGILEVLIHLPRKELQEKAKAIPITTKA